LRESPEVEQLRALREWLERHDNECASTVETWMIRSLPVPTPVIHSVWPDPSWSTPLRNAVVWPVTDGEPDPERVGFLADAGHERGLGIITLDGETARIEASSIGIPHPVLLPDLEELRDFATEANLTQEVLQLHRETWAKPADDEPSKTSVATYAGGRFAQLQHATSRCRTLGYQLRAGNAVCRIWEGGELIEARYWIGSDAPEVETTTGDLTWIARGGRSVALKDIGPVAYSEGVRMAMRIYAGREKREDES
jgi:hypothetical protein